MGKLPRTKIAFPILLLSLALVSGGLPGPRVAALPSGAFVPPYTAEGVDYDSPPNGLFDFLFVNLTIDVATGGEFLAIIQMSSSGLEGRWLQLQSGLHQVQIPLDGHRFRNAGQDGPFTFDLILEVGCREGCQVIDTDSFTTGPFRASDFEDPDWAFAGVPQDAALDTDVPPNGLYDVFVVSVPITVAKPGEYSIWATSPYAGEMRTNVRLSPGDWTVQLSTPGWVLRRSMIQGSFTLSLWLTSRSFSFGGISASVSAGPYDWTTFETSPASLAGGPRDAGIDTDTPPDGRFDILDFVLPVEVNRSGDYRVTAYLSSASGSELDMREKVLYLAEGRQEVEVRFRTHEIAQGAVDGPYRVAYSFRDASFRLLGSGAHTTASYSSSQFDPPLLEWNGLVQDAYVDIDVPPDGIYDRYLLRVPVTVNEAGYYEFVGFFQNAQGDIVASNFTFLARGSILVDLAWSMGAFTAQGTFPSGSPWIYAYSPAFEPLAFQKFIPTPPPDGGGGDATANLSRPDVSIRGSPQTLLPDLDGDGLSDSLDYVLPVNVSRQGPYVFAGMLISVYNGQRVSFATNHTVLAAGTEAVRLSFPGWAVRSSGLSGPYTVFVSYRGGTVDPLPHIFDSVSALFYGYTPVLLAHSFDGDRPSFSSVFTDAQPSVDGALDSAEWQPAAPIDLVTSDPGRLQARAMVANDRDNLYVALDVLGDRTADATDAASLAFDVILPDDPDPGFDAQIGVGFTFRIPEQQFRLAVDTRYFVDEWWLRQAPFDAATPERANLSGAIGFGPSGVDPAAHRIYEFRIPLSLLGASPGETIGFAVCSDYTRGIRDGAGQTFGWPVTSPSYQEVPLSNFARLTLATGAGQRPSVSIDEPAPGSFGAGVVQVSGAAADPDGSVQRVEVRIDDGLWMAASGTTLWSSQVDSRPFPDGPHSLTVRSFDGQAYSTEVRLDVIFDNTGPSLEILSPPGDTILHLRELQVRWTANDSGAGLGQLELSLDGLGPIIFASSEAAAGAYSFAGLSDGSHSLTVVAVDNLGNSRTIVVNVSVDMNPLSLTGPYGSAPLLGLAAGTLAAASVIMYFLLRRREKVQRR